MPVWLRLFTFEKLKEYYTQKKEELEPNTINNNTDLNKIKNIVKQTNYTTTTSKPKNKRGS